MRDLQIEKLEYLKDYQIKLYLSNGQHITYNMAAKLKTARFLDLENPNIFKRGKVVRNKIIKWDDNIEISLAEILMQIAETKKVQGQNVWLKKNED